MEMCQNEWDHIYMLNKTIIKLKKKKKCWVLNWWNPNSNVDESGGMFSCENVSQYETEKEEEEEIEKGRERERKSERGSLTAV